MTDFLPSRFLATTLLARKKIKPAMLAHHHAAGVLQTDTIALIARQEGDSVHVIFADSRDFPTDPASDNYTTPLTAALPGDPNHQGPGVYLQDTPTGTGAIANTPTGITSSTDRMTSLAAGQKARTCLFTM